MPRPVNVPHPTVTRRKRRRESPARGGSSAAARETGQVLSLASETPCPALDETTSPTLSCSGLLVAESTTPPPHSGTRDEDEMATLLLGADEEGEMNYEEEEEGVAGPSTLHGAEAEEGLRARLRTVQPLIRRHVEALQRELAEHDRVSTRLDQLLSTRAETRRRLDALVTARDSTHAVDVARLNVGGTVFVVPLHTLLAREQEGSYFGVLFGPTAHDTLPLFTDPSDGAVFIDRDPEIFRHVLNYLRGANHFQMLDEDVLEKLKVDARYFRLDGLLKRLEGSPERPGVSEANKPAMQFLPGPGVNPERNRLRVIYGVATVGDVYLVTGRHRITFEVVRADYVGVGLASDACVTTDQEFHKTPNCCIYYMSGVFYANFPHHRKEENLERIENGNIVSILLDMDKGFVEFTLKSTTKLVYLGRAKRLRFAVTMKLASCIRILSDEEAERLLQVQRDEVAAAAATAAATSGTAVPA